MGRAIHLSGPGGKGVGPPRRRRRGEIDHAVAGENLFHIHVRQKGLSIKQ